MFVATIIINIKDKGEWVVADRKDISDPVIQVGRSPSNDIQLPYTFVSRRHATLFKYHDRSDYEIMDGTIKETSVGVRKIPSTCGIEVNGIKLDKEQVMLRNNDVITIVPNKISLTYLRLDDEIFSDLQTTYVPPEMREDG